MAKKNDKKNPPTAEGTGPAVEITKVAFAAGSRKSDHARALIRANSALLKGENADAVRSAVVSQLVTDTGLSRALARTYIKENMVRVSKADAKAAAEQEAGRDA